MQAYSAEANDNKFYGGSTTTHQPAVAPPPPRGYASGGVTGADVRSSGNSMGGGGGGVPQLAGFILRAVAIVTTFIATIVMGVNRQSGLKAMDLSQLEYFVSVNAIALVYASGSLALSILNQRSTSSPDSKRILMLVLAIVDVVMVAFLFSGVGSASAISVSFRDTPNFCDTFGEFCSNMGAAIAMSAISVFFRDTPNFCDTFGKFCSNMGAAIAMSTIGAAAFLALTVLSIVRLHSISI